jgi:hypothetical protein
LEKYRSWVRLKWWRMRSPEGCTQIEEERARQKNNTRRSFNFNSSDYGVGSGVPTQGNVGRAKEGDWCGITRLEGRGVRNGVAEIQQSNIGWRIRVVLMIPGRPLEQLEDELLVMGPRRRRLRRLVVRHKVDGFIVCGRWKRNNAVLHDACHLADVGHGEQARGHVPARHRDLVQPPIIPPHEGADLWHPAG